LGSVCFFAGPSAMVLRLNGCDLPAACCDMAATATTRARPRAVSRVRSATAQGTEREGATRFLREGLTWPDAQKLLRAGVAAHARAGWRSQRRRH
jgi:hypothetical protein